jgi:hypothetical protein
MSTDENRLFRPLWPQLQARDIVVGDRHFCSYGNVAGLKQQQVESLFRLHSKRNASFRQGRPLGKDDRLVTWAKSAYRPTGLSPEAWQRFPDQGLRFKGALDTLRHYSQTILRVPASHGKRRRRWVRRMLEVITEDLVPDRPDRREPLCLKKRPKPYPWLTGPRRQMKDRPKWRPRNPKNQSCLT